MPELSLMEIIKNSFNSLLESKVLVLLLLEIAILFMALIFSRLMNKKVVKISCIVESLIIFGLYISSYVGTMTTFINNVSTKLVELVYFPTTLEFMIVMVLSIVVMIGTWLNKKSKIVLKVVNTAFPIAISFLFLSIIEYINSNNVPFDEFSVFTNPVLMSLYELAMVLFISWVIGLIVYKIDKLIIESINTIEENDIDTNTISIDASEDDIEIELPKLKSGLIK